MSLVSAIEQDPYRSAQLQRLARIINILHGASADNTLSNKAMTKVLICLRR